MSLSTRMSCRVSFARFPLFAAVLCMVLTTAHAASVTWTNAPGTASWTNGANWSGGVAPAAVDSVFLTNLTKTYTVSFDTASPVVITNLTMVGGGANTATLNINSGMLMVTGVLATVVRSNTVLNVNSGGVLYQQTAASTWYGGNLNVNGGAWTNISKLTLSADSGRTLALCVNSGNLYTVGGIDLTASAGVAQFVVSGGYVRLSGFIQAYGGGITNNVVSVAGGVLDLGGGSSGLNPRQGTILLSGGAITNGGIVLGYSTAGSNVMTQTGGLGDYSVLAVGQGGTAGSAASYGFYTLGGGVVTNSGSLKLGARIGGYGVLTITNGNWFQKGVVYVGGGDLVYSNNFGNLTISGGSFVATNGLQVAADIGSTGSVTVGGGALAVTNATKTAWLEVGRRGAGTLNLSNGTLLVDRLLVTNGASSVVNFAGGALQSRSTTVSNGTLFTVGDGLSAASLSLNGGSHRFANNLLVSSNATLAGTGTVVATTLTSHGTIAPGFSPGTLTVTGDVSLASDSILSMELSGTNAGAYDVLNVVGNLSLGGALKVSLLSYAPLESNAFKLFNGTLSGAFQSYDLPTLGEGLNWDTSQLGVNGTLLVFAVPEPGTFGLMGIVLLAAGAWGFRCRKT